MNPKTPNQSTDKSCSDTTSRWYLYRRLLGYARPYIGVFSVSIAGFFVYALGSILLIDSIKFLLDAFSETDGGDFSLIAIMLNWVFSSRDYIILDRFRIVILVVLIVASFGRAIGFFIGNYFMSLVTYSVMHTLRIELFEAMMRMPRVYYDRNVRNRLISKIIFNIEQFSGMLGGALKALLCEGLTIIGSVSYMLYLNWKMTLIFFVTVPAFVVIASVVARHFRRYSQRIQDSMGLIAQYGSESLEAFETLKIYAAESQQIANFNRASKFNRDQTFKLFFVRSLSSPIFQVLLALALAVLFWFALDPDVIVDFPAGTLVVFLTVAGQMSKPIRTLSNIHSDICAALVAAEDLFEHIDQCPETDEGTRSIQRASGRIELDQVSFRYPNARTYALNKVSLIIEPGETVAFVGRSGSGKSTLVQLLLRFYDPGHGAIYLDNQEISEYILADYRRQFSVVSQSINLLSETIRNNIAIGELNTASYNEVLVASQRAHAIEFIERMPDGLDTVLMNNGGNLSGGQCQRLAIARALLKNAPVLILDEATSALDNESEALIQLALEEVTADSTTLIIAHRLSTIERADRVVVLDQGCIVAQGRHADLLDQSSLYSKLYQQELIGQ